MRKRNEAASGEVQVGHWAKVLQQDGALSVEQVPQGSGCGTKRVRVQGQCMTLLVIWFSFG